MHVLWEGSENGRARHGARASKSYVRGCSEKGQTLQETCSLCHLTFLMHYTGVIILCFMSMGALSTSISESKGGQQRENRGWLVTVCCS